jgi:hypothetical protein
MKQIVRNVSLDLSRRSGKRYFYGNKTEFNSRVFVIRLMDDGVPYVVDKSASAIVNVLRSDGRSWSYLCDITEDGCVYFASTLWCFDAPGETKLTVTLFNSKMRITSAPFYIDVADDLPGTEHSDEIAENVTLFQQAMEHFASINEDESERVENEKQRVNDERARRNAEADRLIREAEREEREAVRCRNEEARIKITESMTEALDNLIYLQQIYIERGEMAI